MKKTIVAEADLEVGDEAVEKQVVKKELVVEALETGVLERGCWLKLSLAKA